LYANKGAIRLIAAALSLFALPAPARAQYLQGPQRWRGVPVFRANGSMSASANAAVPALPAGTVAGDLLIMGIETHDPDGAVTASGWASAPGSPVSSGNARLTVLYKIAAGGDATTTSDSGDHQGAAIVGVKAGTFNRTSPFNANQASTQASTVSISITGTTPTAGQCLWVAFSGGDLPDSSSGCSVSSDANSNLTSVTQRLASCSLVGSASGLHLYIVTGVKATIGAIGSSTATAAVAAARANLGLAVCSP
jgi:hypothetical protein